MYVCVYVCIYMYVHICIYMCMYIYICMDIYVYIRTYIRTYIYVYIYMYIYIRVYMCVYIYISVCVCIIFTLLQFLKVGYICCFKSNFNLRIFYVFNCCNYCFIALLCIAPPSGSLAPLLWCCAMFKCRQKYHYNKAGVLTDDDPRHLDEITEGDVSSYLCF